MQHICMEAIALFAMLCVAASVTSAGVKFETIEYKQGDAALEGYLAYDDALQGNRPACSSSINF